MSRLGLVVASILALSTAAACGGIVSDPNAVGDETGPAPAATGPAVDPGPADAGPVHAGDAVVAPHETGAPFVDAGDPPVDPDTCVGPDFSAALSAARASCASPLPSKIVDGHPELVTAFRTFVVGRWLTCPSSTGAAIPGPKDNVGVEFTADGRAYFLKVDCGGAIVRGSGGAITDAGPGSTWENSYEIHADTGQVNFYFGGPPSTALWASILHARFDDGPRRLRFDNEGVYQSMYVPAPEHL